MTLLEAISKADDLAPNAYPQTDKLRWLSEAEAQVRAAGEGGVPEPFGQDTPLDTLLGAPCPYEELYLQYLLSRIHYHNGEIALYNEAVTLFQARFTDYANWYRRSHLPEGREWKYY